MDNDSHLLMQLLLFAGRKGGGTERSYPIIKSHPHGLHMDQTHRHESLRRPLKGPSLGCVGSNISLIDEFSILEVEWVETKIGKCKRELGR